MSIIREFRFTSSTGEEIVGKLIKGYVAQYINSDYWILSKGYQLYKYYPKTDVIRYFSKLQDTKVALFSKFKLSRRLLRAEITHLYRFNEDWFCIARKAIFKYNPANGLFEICHRVTRGSRPMNLCCDKDGIIYFGEYFYNPELAPVSIIRSKDRGQTWETAYTFEKGEINHIHGIFFDRFTDRLWVFTGDIDKACIAGYTTDGFSTFHREFEGEQEYRVCVPLFQKDHIVYPTDSQYTTNSIRQIDRSTKEISDLETIQGSGIYAVDTGRFKLISTTVEPSVVNTDKFSHLWISSDGVSWRELISFEKDMWKTTIFQFGSIRFPYYDEYCEDIIITGRALKTLDQNTLIISGSNLKK